MALSSGLGIFLTFFLFVCVFEASVIALPQKIFNVMNYGAVADGKTDSSQLKVVELWMAKDLLLGAYNDCAQNSQCPPLPATLRFDFVNNSRVHHLRSINSKNAHFSIFACNNMNISHVKIMAPSNSPNTDGIHIVKISTYLTFFVAPGHGISIGSLGRDHENDYVQGIHIRNCTFSGTENGVRIKTWSPSLKSLASDMKFEDIFIKNASNPIVIDQEYCPRAPCIPEGQSTSDVQIKNVTFKNIWGTSSSKVAVNLECSKKVPCQKIEFININLSYNGHGIATSVCANVIDSSYTKKMPPGCV
ncbi:glycoside hydrolase family 28 protein/polygalacturonase (pectinase) family protein [Abeliophyllum distichum]|uniref:Glycoside hydrolase family 28 protein/polygalacturonase (Pectinase) family protein n=1 Tax=Abeliophyllum distichum TaxID=126358 RepID=A0ABD1PSS0_9LAMI